MLSTSDFRNKNVLSHYKATDNRCIHPFSTSTYLPIIWLSSIHNCIPSLLYISIYIYIYIHLSTTQHNNSLNERWTTLSHLHTILRGVFCFGVDVNDRSQYTNKYRLRQVLRQTDRDLTIHHGSADAATPLVKALTVKTNLRGWCGVVCGFKGFALLPWVLFYGRVQTVCSTPTRPSWMPPLII